MNVRQLLTSAAVRHAAHRMLQEAPAGKLQCWTIDMDRLPEVADLVATITRRNYPSLAIPFHSRWRHFDVGGVDRWAALQRHWGPLPPRELARRAFDLVIPSVLSDAGSGGRWSFVDPYTGQNFTSSEGLALASLQLYQSLVDASPSGVLEAALLETLTEERFARLFQVSDAKPLAGVPGRVALLRALGVTCRSRPDAFALEGPARPGGLVDAMLAKSHNGSITAPDMLAIVLDALGPIWPSRLTLQGVPLGDSWIYPPWQVGTRPDEDSIVPFHKLSQWLTFSLIEPLQQAGLTVTDIDGLTGLAEYRNGGLFVDGGVLRLKEPRMQAQSHGADSLLVIEWRALTVALLDRLQPLVAERLGLTAEEFPLPCLLEGGSWAAGRYIAHQLRQDRSPPITIISDGTVF
jgi:hypothetical protein